MTQHDHFCGDGIDNEFFFQAATIAESNTETYEKKQVNRYKCLHTQEEW